jgi:hypothetical protein
MTDFNFNFQVLTPEEQKQMILPRLKQAERQVFQYELDKLAQNIAGEYAPLVEAQAYLDKLNGMLKNIENNMLVANDNG